MSTSNTDELHGNLAMPTDLDVPVVKDDDELILIPGCLFSPEELLNTSKCA